MRSAFLVRTRFILNIFSVIGLGGSQDPPLATPLAVLPSVGQLLLN